MSINDCLCRECSFRMFCKAHQQGLEPLQSKRNKSSKVTGQPLLFSAPTTSSISKKLLPVSMSGLVFSPQELAKLEAETIQKSKVYDDYLHKFGRYKILITGPHRIMVGRRYKYKVRIFDYRGACTRYRPLLFGLCRGRKYTPQKYPTIKVLIPGRYVIKASITYDDRVFTGTKVIHAIVSKAELKRLTMGENSKNYEETN